MKSDVKSGQTVVMYEPYANRGTGYAKAVTVTKVGTKYITAGGFKFDRGTLRCTERSLALYIGTQDEYDRWHTACKQVRDKLALVEVGGRKVSLLGADELRQAEELLDRLIDILV